MITAPARADINIDFPLRGFVRCGGCGNAFAGAWSKGKCKYYAYYRCQNKACSENKASIPRAMVEGEFETLLKSLLPSRKLSVLLHDILHDLWDQRLATWNGDRKALVRQKKKIEGDIDVLADRIVETKTASVVAAFERKITALESERIKLTEQLENDMRPTKTFRELYERALKFLSNPWKIWEMVILKTAVCCSN